MTITSKVHGVDMTRRIEVYLGVKQAAYEAYLAVERPAWEAYLAVERPAREAYLAVERPAREAAKAVRRSAWEACEAVQQSAWEAYLAVERPAREAYLAAQRAAWEALACGNPLVDWIIANCAAHESEALTILRALPADLDTLDDIATDAGWCSAWEALRDEAIRAGVISQ